MVTWQRLVSPCRGGSRILGRGGGAGSNKAGRGRASKGSAGRSPSGFLHLRLFSMKMNIVVISPQNNLILITTSTNGITIISKHNVI